MNKETRLAWKVGAFVLISLALFVGLIIRFSKGSSLLTPTYSLQLKAKNVAGIVPGAVVLMLGVPIGNVERIGIAADGLTVEIRVKLQKKFPIHSDAVFAIRQAGFLGDRYIAVTSTRNTGPILGNKDSVPIEEAFDVQEVAKSATGLLKRVEEVVGQLNQAVTRLDRTLLSSETLTNLMETAAKIHRISGTALNAVQSIDGFVNTNLASLGTSVTNLGRFTAQLNEISSQLQETVATNRPVLADAVRNIEGATAKINHLMAEVNEGKGLAGKLLRSEQISVDVSVTISNLAVLSSNINNKGFWGVMFKPKLPPQKETRR